MEYLWIGDVAWYIGLRMALYVHSQTKVLFDQNFSTILCNNNTENLLKNGLKKLHNKKLGNPLFCLK